MNLLYIYLSLRVQKEMLCIYTVKFQEMENDVTLNYECIHVQTQNGKPREKPRDKPSQVCYGINTKYYQHNIRHGVNGKSCSRTMNPLHMLYMYMFMIYNLCNVVNLCIRGWLTFEYHRCIEYYMLYKSKHKEL